MWERRAETNLPQPDRNFAWIQLVAEMLYPARTESDLTLLIGIRLVSEQWMSYFPLEFNPISLV